MGFLHTYLESVVKFPTHAVEQGDPMTDTTRILVGTVLPPLTLPTRRARPDRSAGSLRRLGRIVCVLAALALPALGIAVSDTVHRAGAPGATQAAAPVDPSDGAAASARKTAVDRIATLGAARDGGRP